MRRPSAFLPLAMSLAAIALVVWFVATFGVVRQPHDEGAAARLFQLLIGTQVPIVAWFALMWLPRAPRPATLVLTLQGCAALVAIALVVMLER
jgi:hypothetical protein